MKTTISLLALALGSILVVGCTDDDTVGPIDDTDSGTEAGKTDSSFADTGTPDTGTTDTSTGDAGHPPPALGAQIDRMGRPAINTATNHAFDANTTTKDTAKDGWNQNSNPSTWVATYKSEVAANLGILDSLDNVCGNQLFAASAPVDAGTPDASAPDAGGAARYDTFAGVLADDRLWVKSDATACTQYLAVEANATGLLANTDCGGRVPSYEVMKITYSAVAVGALTGVTDGTTPLAKSKVTAFPYLAPAL
jgi:hypothetical protein